jgi:DNA-binding PadR family transcriptional regulator
MADKQPSTTSHAILGLLSLRDWSAYELVQQMERGVGIMWSSAPSMVYYEAKALVTSGLASARLERRDGRRRTVYSITPLGVSKLRSWLAIPGSGPQLHFEGWLKVLFADSGTKADLVATMSSARMWAEEVQVQGRRLASGYLGGVYLDGTVPLERRAQVLPLTFSLLWDLSELIIHWSEWVEQRLDDWPQDGEPAVLDREPFETALRGERILSGSRGRRD